jgi:hypothetical protein
MVRATSVIGQNPGLTFYIASRSSVVHTHSARTGPQSPQLPLSAKQELCTPPSAHYCAATHIRCEQSPPKEIRQSPIALPPLRSPRTSLQEQARCPTRPTIQPSRARPGTKALKRDAVRKKYRAQGGLCPHLTPNMAALRTNNCLRR